jgi:hypothetical protein
MWSPIYRPGLPADWLHTAAFSWPVDILPYNQDIPSLLWDTTVHYRVHKSLSPDPFLSQMNPLHPVPSCFCYLCLSISHSKLPTVLSRHVQWHSDLFCSYEPCTAYSIQHTAYSIQHTAYRLYCYLIVSPCILTYWIWYIPTNALFYTIMY